MRIKWYYFRKCLFCPNYEIFLAKNQKIFSVGKIERLENMMKKECFSEKKKHFHLLKSLFYKNGKAQNMPVVASRLVLEQTQKKSVQFDFSIRIRIRNSVCYPRLSLSLSLSLSSLSGSILFFQIFFYFPACLFNLLPNII